MNRARQKQMLFNIYLMFFINFYSERDGKYLFPYLFMINGQDFRFLRFGRRARFFTGSKLPDLAVGTIVFFLVGIGAYRIFQLSK